MEENKQKKENFNDFIKETRINLLSQLDEINNNVEKAAFLTVFSKETNELIQGYTKIVKFAKMLKEEIFNEDPTTKKILIFVEMVDEGLYIKWNKNKSIYEVDFDRSPSIKNEENKLILPYKKNIVSTIINELTVKLDKNEESHLLEKNILLDEDWSKIKNGRID